MDHDAPLAAPSPAEDCSGSGSWSAPCFEVISLDCEITAYAPDGGDPLF